MRRAQQVLQNVGAKIFGVVLNQVNLREHDYYYYGGYYGYGGAALATGVLIGAAIAANRHQDHYIQVPVPYQAPVIEQPAIAPPPADPMQTCPDGSAVPANSDCPRHYRGAGVPVPSGISKDDLRDD